MQERDGSGAIVHDFGPGPEPEAEAVALGSVVPGLNSGWISYAYWTRPSGHAITHDSATWVVPDSPTSSDGQTIFLFNGLQILTVILQPVLQWGSSFAGGGNYWSGTCWYVVESTDTTVYTSTLLSADEGDGILGTVDSASSGGGYECGFHTPGDSASLHVSGAGPELTQAVVTLEAYGLSTCSDYPSSTKTSFTALSIRAHGLTPSEPWTPHNRITDCNQNDSLVSNANPGGQNDIYYRLPLVASISGPREIDSKCTCTWSAEPSGGKDGYTYQWVLRYDGGSDETEGTLSSESLTVDEGDPNFYWILTVGSSGQYVTDSIYVTNCIGEGPGCGAMRPGIKRP